MIVTNLVQDAALLGGEPDLGYHECVSGLDA
jgi:hypothetical protein